MSVSRLHGQAGLPAALHPSQRANPMTLTTASVAAGISVFICACGDRGMHGALRDCVRWWWCVGGRFDLHLWVEREWCVLRGEALL